MRRRCPSARVRTSPAGAATSEASSAVPASAAGVSTASLPLPTALHPAGRLGLSAGAVGAYVERRVVVAVPGQGVVVASGCHPFRVTGWPGDRATPHRTSVADRGSPVGADEESSQCSSPAMDGDDDGRFGVTVSPRSAIGAIRVAGLCSRPLALMRSWAWSLYMAVSFPVRQMARRPPPPAQSLCNACGVEALRAVVGDALRARTFSSQDEVREEGTCSRIGTGPLACGADAGRGLIGPRSRAARRSTMRSAGTPFPSPRSAACEPSRHSSMRSAGIPRSGRSTSRQRCLVLELCRHDGPGPLRKRVDGAWAGPLRAPRRSGAPVGCCRARRNLCGLDHRCLGGTAAPRGGV